MPWTMPHTATAHVWLEPSEEAGTPPLCGEDPTGDVVFDLVRLEEREFNTGSPNSIRGWVMWDTSVCRECAERLVDEMGLIGPIQWIPQIGRTRTRRCREAGVLTFRDVVDRYITPDGEYLHGLCKDETGMVGNGCTLLLNGVAMERWRKETESRGITWLIEEVHG